MHPPSGGATPLPRSGKDGWPPRPAGRHDIDWSPASVGRRHALLVSGPMLSPWNITLGAISQIRSSLPFSAINYASNLQRAELAMRFIL